jgi:hypothetical protein
MWIFLLLLFLQSNAAPCSSATPPPAGAPSLIVQAVDPDYIPIPGAHVMVKPLNSNAQTILSSTDGDGYARIFAPEDTEYSVEINLVGFKNDRVKSLHLGNRTHAPHTAYIQFVMKLSGSGVAIY